MSHIIKDILNSYHTTNLISVQLFKNDKNSSPPPTHSMSHIIKNILNSYHTTNLISVLLF